MRALLLPATMRHHTNAGLNFEESLFILNGQALEPIATRPRVRSQRLCVPGIEESVCLERLFRKMFGDMREKQTHLSRIAIQLQALYGPWDRRIHGLGPSGGPGPSRLVSSSMTSTVSVSRLTLSPHLILGAGLPCVRRSSNVSWRTSRICLSENSLEYS